MLLNPHLNFTKWAKILPGAATSSPRSLVWHVTCDEDPGEISELHMCACAYVCVRACACVRARVRVYICVYVYMCIYIYS